MDSLDLLHFDALEKIVDFLPYRDRRALSQTSRRYTGFKPDLELQTLGLTIKSNFIHICTPSLERSMAYHFLTPHQHATTTSYIPGAKGSNCARKFPFPPTGQYSFFAGAKIDNLELGHNLRLCVDNDNIKHFASLFSGCRVDNVIMNLDWKTGFQAGFAKFHGDLDRLDIFKKELPVFLGSVKAKHVEFRLDRHHYEMMAVFFVGSTLAWSLVRAGIKEITFCGGHIFSHDDIFESLDANAPYMLQYRILGAKPLFTFDLFVKLFNAGIESINVKSDQPAIPMSDHVLDHLIEKLSKVGKPLRLQIDVSTLRETIPVGRYGSDEDEKKGIFVNVAESSTCRFNRLITIECKQIAADH